MSVLLLCFVICCVLTSRATVVEEVKNTSAMNQCGTTACSHCSLTVKEPQCVIWPQIWTEEIWAWLTLTCSRGMMCSQLVLRETKTSANDLSSQSDSIDSPPKHDNQLQVKVCVFRITEYMFLMSNIFLVPTWPDHYMIYSTSLHDILYNITSYTLHYYHEGNYSNIRHDKDTFDEGSNWTDDFSEIHELFPGKSSKMSKNLVKESEKGI